MSGEDASIWKAIAIGLAVLLLLLLIAGGLVVAGIMDLGFSLL